MTAKSSSKKSPPAVAQAKPVSQPLKPWLRDLIACVVIYLAVVFMFHEIVLMNKEFSKGDDTEASHALNEYARQATEETGTFPLWCPNLFAGYPSFAAGAYSNYEYMQAPYSLANRWLSPRYWLDVVTIRGLLFDFTGGHNESKWLVALLLYGGLAMYYLMRRLKLEILPSLMCAIIMAWNPYYISLATAAHGGKLMSLIYLPLIILFAWNLLKKRTLINLALLAITFGWQIAVGGHTQILFYSGLTMIILAVVWAVFELREKNVLAVVHSAGFYTAAVILAVCVGSLWYIPLYTYLPYSIRGMGPAIAAAGQSGYSMTDATQWSFPPSEILTYIAPSWFGLKSPYYWGDMPFTSSSFYFGIVPFLLALFALFGKKTRLMWALITIAAVSLLLSFGKYFDFFYGIFFKFFPFFDKFRTPSLILLLFNLSAIILSGFGINFVIEKFGDEKWKKIFRIGTIAAVAVFALVLITGDSLSGAFGSYVKEGDVSRYQPAQLTQLKTARIGLLKNDLLLAMFWLTAAFGLCFGYVSGKIKKTAWTVAILLMVAADLFIFSNKFFDPQPHGAQSSILKTNRVVESLKQDKTIFRVMPLGQQLSSDNRWAAWNIQSLSGYHAAKMRSWTDLSENVFFSGDNPQFPINYDYFSSMNCKYFITQGKLPDDNPLKMVITDPEAQWVLYQNPNYFERAYFVDNVVVEPDRARTITALKNPDFDFKTTAIVDESLPGPIHSGERTVSIASYEIHDVKLTANNREPSFLVFSDAHYAPGWIATVDGQPSHIYKVNGFVRGLYLESGDHQIEFIYQGKSEHRGVTVATTSYFIVMALLAFGWYTNRKKKFAPMTESIVNNTVLRGQHLVKFYGRRKVVDDISIQLSTGEVVGLLGPNGAGKTTTFYMMTGMIQPKSGDIHFGDVTVTDLPMYKRARLGIGYLAQEPSVFRKLTVEENLMAILELMPIRKNDRRARMEELLEEFHITHVRRNKGYQLSGGERRRVEIARSLVSNPRFMLLDEPFAGIDPIAVNDIQQIVTGLKARGIGVLITDHNVHETLAITDRSYLIHSGRMLKEGTAEFLANDEEARKIYLGESFKLNR